MTIKLTKIYVLREIDSWKKVGELLHHSGNSGSREQEARVEEMLAELEASGFVYSYPAGIANTMSYIQRKRISGEEITLRDAYKIQRKAA